VKAPQFNFLFSVSFLDDINGALDGTVRGDWFGMEIVTKGMILLDGEWYRPAFAS
jgi:hypothetical protein